MEKNSCICNLLMVYQLHILQVFFKKVVVVHSPDSVNGKKNNVTQTLRYESIQSNLQQELFVYVHRTRRDTTFSSQINNLFLDCVNPFLNREKLSASLTMDLTVLTV